MRFAMFAVLVLVACSSSTGARLVPALSVVAGAAQADTVTKQLPQLIAVQVTDSRSGAPLASYPLNWIALDGGSVFAPNTPSGADGIARQRVTLGTGAGQQCFAARALDPNTGDVLVDVQACATATPDVADSFYFGSVAGRTQLNFPAGDSTPLLLTYGDRYRNADARCAAAASDSSVTISIATTAPGAADYRVAGDTVWLRGSAPTSGTIFGEAACVGIGRAHDARSFTVR